MAIAKAAIGSLVFSIGNPVQVGVAFFDSGGNTVDVQSFPLPIAAYGSKAALKSAIDSQAIAYAATQGSTIISSDVLSVY